jgi:hypothetical protein
MTMGDPADWPELALAAWRDERRVPFVVSRARRPAAPPSGGPYSADHRDRSGRGQSRVLERPAGRPAEEPR